MATPHIRFARTALSSVALAAVAAVAAVVLAGCAPIPPMSKPVASALYQGVDEASADSAVLELPSWIPDDASSIRVKIRTDGAGAIMHFATAGLSEDCTPGELEAYPDLADSWWPETLATEGVICDDWSIVVQGGEVYAWTLGDARPTVTS